MHLSWGRGDRSSPLHYLWIRHCECLILHRFQDIAPFISALHVMPARTSDEKVVRLSVRPFVPSVGLSVKRAVCQTRAL